MKGARGGSNTNVQTIAMVMLILFTMFAAFKFGQYSGRNEKSKKVKDVVDPDVSKIDNTVAIDEGAIQTLSWKPRVFYYPKFASEEECDHIIDIAGSFVERSKVVGANGEDMVDTARTSYGTFLVRQANDPIVRKLEDKIAKWTHLPWENGENFYLLRYNNGQEYKPHWDWFYDTSGRLGPAGNRMATVLIYLSEVEEGGETIFPRAEGGELAVKPKKGDAVLFWDMTTNGKTDEESLHGGRPVTKGTKWVMTKWIRQAKFRSEA